MEKMEPSFQTAATNRPLSTANPLSFSTLYGFSSLQRRFTLRRIGSCLALCALPFAFFSWKSSLLIDIAAWGFLILARKYVIVPYMLLPSIFLFRGKAAELNNYRAQFRSKSVKMYPVSFITNDGVKLSAVELESASNGSKPGSEQHWILWLNPNGVAFEAILPFLSNYAETTNTSILAFNYRGVGLSEGLPLTGEDLIQDGIAAMMHLIKTGIRPENVLIHGFSMGGGVGGQLRKLFPKGPIIHDRSFSSLGNTVKGLFGPYIGAIASLGLDTIGWDILDSAEAWPHITGQKLIVYHPKDAMIRYSPASLALAIKNSPSAKSTNFFELKTRFFVATTDGNSVFGPYGTATMEEAQDMAREEISRKSNVTGQIQVIEITSEHQLYHCYLLDSNGRPSDWNDLVKFVQNCFPE